MYFMSEQSDNKNESGQDCPADSGCSPDNGDTGFLLVTAVLLLIIAVAVFRALPADCWPPARENTASIVSAYMQAGDRTEIALYCRRIAALAASSSTAVSEISRLSLEYAPEASEAEWLHSMESQIDTIQRNATQARDMKPPLACANAHETSVKGLEMMAEAAQSLKESLPDMEPLLIRSSHQRMEDGLLLVQEGLGSLSAVNQSI